jgi:hypothetical protein
MLIRDHFPAGASGQQLAPSTIMAAPLIEIVRTLADMDALRQVSPEVFSPDNATRTWVPQLSSVLIGEFVG